MASSTKKRMTQQGNQIRDIQAKQREFIGTFQDYDIRLDVERDIRLDELQLQVGELNSKIERFEKIGQTDNFKNRVSELSERTDNTSARLGAAAKAGELSFDEIQQYQKEVNQLRLNSAGIDMMSADELLLRQQQQQRAQQSKLITSGLVANAVITAANTYTRTIAVRTGDDLAQREWQRRLSMLSRVGGIAAAGILVSLPAAGAAVAGMAIQWTAQNYSQQQQVNRNNQSAEARNFARGKMSYEGSR